MNDTTNDRSPYKSRAGLERIFRAFGYSLAGLQAALRHEHAFRQELILAVLLIGAVPFLPANGVGKAIMVGSVLLVLIVELLNSAVEAVVDRVSLDHHPLAGRAKDIGSAAVLLALLNVAACWGLVLFG
ncbi:MAG TPA: diacylglycerol kinase [Rhodocyclaceae bacterium]|nr:diacylglycerol kinase [Rhodocyclaceae bacterium]